MLENPKTLSSQESTTMTKLENTLSSFSEKPEILKHIDKADQLKTRDAIKEYGKRNKVWSHPTFQGYYESTEHVKPETYDDYRSKVAKQASITREWNYKTGKREEFSEETKTGKLPPKLKKALKVAGAVGTIGALGAAGAIAGDALNLWDLGKVEGIAGTVLSPLDKAGNALNKMALSKHIKFDKHNLELKDSFDRVMHDNRYRYEPDTRVRVRPKGSEYGVYAPFDPEGHPFEKMITSAYNFN